MQFAILQFKSFPSSEKWLPLPTEHELPQIKDRYEEANHPVSYDDAADGGWGRDHKD